MSAPTLAEKMLVALANEPMSEQDFRVTFPKSSLEAMRQKLSELRKLGQIVERDGVYRLAPGKVAPAEAVERVEAAQRAEKTVATETKTFATTAALKQRQAKPVPAAAPEPALKTKACPRCHETKPVSEFGRKSNSRDGLQCYCRPCHREAARESLRRVAERRKLRNAAPAAPVSIIVDGRLSATSAGDAMAAVQAAVKERDVTIVPPAKASEHPAGRALPAGAEGGLAVGPARRCEGVGETAAASARPEPANVLPFPGAKTLEDVVTRHTAPAGVTVRALTHVLFRDPDTGQAYGLLLSQAGVKLLREALGPL